MRKLFTFLLLGIFMFSLGIVSAYETHKQNTEYVYSETVANAESCNITLIKYPQGNATINQGMTNTGDLVLSILLTLEILHNWEIPVGG